MSDTDERNEPSVDLGRGHRIRDLIIQSSTNRRILEVLFVHSIWIQIASNRSDSPLFLVMRWRDRLTTKPRDKIYGLLGLLKTQRSLPQIEKCNYETPVTEVYSLLIIELIVYERDLMPLVNDPRLEAETTTEGMPSWAIDLKGVAVHDTDWYHMYGYKRYNANDGLPPLDLEALQAASTESKNTTLKLKGIKVDLVQEVYQGIRVLGYGTTEISVHTIQAWYDAAQRSGGHSQQEAFSRLIIGDLVR